MFLLCDIFTQLIRFISKESSEEKQLMKEIVKLRKQLKGISMVDQFVSYAKLQRKINALQEQYKEKGKSTLIMFFEFFFSKFNRNLIKDCILT